MARYVFTGGNGVSGETGLVVRNGLNNNFVELYAGLHTRIHAMTSASDHSASSVGDRNKYLKAHPTTGVPIWSPILDADIPITICRADALATHIANKDNPHEVQLSDIAQPGPGMEFGGTPEMALVSALAKDDRGLGVGEFGFELNIDNVADAINMLTADASDRFFIHRKYGTGEGAVNTIVSLTLSELKGYVLYNPGGGGALSDYLIEETVGKVVSVMATGEGVTAAWASGNQLTISVPAGVEITSINIALASYPNMLLILDYEVPRATPWFPIIQAWREDTQNQLVGVVTTGSDTVPGAFAISGLINTTTNHIRLIL